MATIGGYDRYRTIFLYEEKDWLFVWMLETPRFAEDSLQSNGPTQLRTKGASPDQAFRLFENVEKRLRLADETSSSLEVNRIGSIIRSRFHQFILGRDEWGFSPDASIENGDKPSPTGDPLAD